MTTADKIAALPEMPNMRVLLDEFSKVNAQPHVQEDDARRKYKELESAALRARLSLALEVLQEWADDFGCGCNGPTCTMCKTRIVLEAMKELR